MVLVWGQGGEAGPRQEAGKSEPGKGHSGFSPTFRRDRARTASSRQARIYTPGTRSCHPPSAWLALPPWTPGTKPGSSARTSPCPASLPGEVHPPSPAVIRIDHPPLGGVLARPPKAWVSAEDMALAWGRCPPANTTSQRLPWLWACLGLSGWGQGSAKRHELQPRGMEARRGRPLPSVQPPFRSAAVTSSTALGAQPAGPLSSAVLTAVVPCSAGHRPCPCTCGCRDSWARGRAARPSVGRARAQGAAARAGLHLRTNHLAP